MTNILFSCAGRRNYLLRYFREALKARGEDGKIIATDASESAPAFADADVAVIAPRVDASDYVERTLEICKENDVKLLFSLNDIDLPMIAQNRERFLQIGVTPIVSDPSVVDVAFDKWKTSQFLQDAGLPCPQTYLTLGDAKDALASGKINFPLIVKPRWGSGSIGVETVESLKELDEIYALVNYKVSKSVLNSVSSKDSKRCVLIQEKIVGREYGLDVIDNLNCEYVATIIKEKLAMRAGETDKARVVENEAIRRLGEKIGRNLKHRALLDVDVLERDGSYYVLEMNPRFGGGYPFSHEAGANVPLAILSWAKGETPWSRWFQPMVKEPFAKCDRLVVVGRNV